VGNHSLREQHSHTTTYIPSQLPDAVVFAESTEDVQQVVRVCAEHKVPIIPFGTGTSLEGGVNAPAGGISIDLMRMNKVLSVNSEDLDVTLQPGVTREELNVALRDQGLFFPIDPGANASLGGMAATRASGTNAVRYGTMRDNVGNADWLAFGAYRVARHTHDRCYQPLFQIGHGVEANTHVGVSWHGHWCS